MLRCRKKFASVMPTMAFKCFPHLMLQTRFLKTSPAAPLSSSSALQSSFTVQFLTNTCGISLKTALSISPRIQLDEKEAPRYQLVLAFLKSYGFTDTDIGKLVTKTFCVSIFRRQRLETILKPKFEYLVDCGFVGSLLPTVVLSHPSLINLSLESHLKPLIDFLKKYLNSNENILTALRHAGSRVLSMPRIQQNVELLLNMSVPIENIHRLLLRKPDVLMQKSDRLMYAVNYIKGFGRLPNSGMFPKTLEVITYMRDSTLKRKLNFFKSLGWSEEDIFGSIMRSPDTITTSEEKVKNSLDFYVNVMKIEPGRIIRTPLLLGYSIEKRVLPRYNLLKFLESNNFINPIQSYVKAIRLSEKLFVEKYVRKHESKVPDLMKFYKSDE